MRNIFHRIQQSKILRVIGFFWILSLIVIAIIADANDWFKEKESTTTTYTNTSLEPPRNEERLVFPVNNTASKKECNEAITIIKGELENSTRELLSINEQAKQAEFHGSGFTEIDKFTITQAILRSTALQTLFLEQIKQKLSSCEEVQRIGFLKQENEIIEGFTALGMFFNDEIDLYEVQNIIQPLSIAPPIQDSISTNSVINFRDAGKKEDSSFSVENFVSEIREEYPELDKIKITVTPFPFVNEEGSLRKYLGLYYHPEGQEPTLYLSNDIPEQRMRNVFFRILSPSLFPRFIRRRKTNMGTTIREQRLWNIEGI